MIETEAAEQLASLGHPARLRVLRTLMAAGTAGVPAGDLARAAELAPNATTFHLNRLRLAGLVHRRRTGREARYMVDFAAVRALLDYLGTTCCMNADPDHRCHSLCEAGESNGVAANSTSNEEVPR